VGENVAETVGATSSEGFLASAVLLECSRSLMRVVFVVGVVAAVRGGDGGLGGWSGVTSDVQR